MSPGHQRGEGDAAAGTPVQARPGPDLAPGVPGDEVLEVGGQAGRRGLGPIHMGVAEDRPADRHPGRVPIGVVGRHWPAEVGGQCPPDRSRLFDAGEVRRMGDLHQGGVRDAVGEFARVRGRGRQVVPPGDDKGRHGDATEVRPQVVAGQRVAAGGVAGRVHSGEFGEKAADPVRGPIGESGGEPACGCGSHQRGRALLADDGGAVTPAVRFPETRGRADQGQRAEPLCPVDAEVGSDRTTERDPRIRELGVAVHVGQFQDEFGEIRNAGPGPGFSPGHVGGGATVTRQVETQHPVVAGESPDQFVPDVQGGAKRRAEQQRRPGHRAVDAVVQADGAAHASPRVRGRVSRPL